MEEIVGEFFVAVSEAKELQHWAIVARRDLDSVWAGNDVDAHHSRYAVEYSIGDGTGCGRAAKMKI